jgi:septal ring factor EnvC (AmiA/AmiB activator)
MKQIPALIAAFTITGLIGFVMISVGASAITNKNTVAITNAPASASAAAAPAAGSAASTSGSQDSTQAQIQQLQERINQYQQREQQYQSQVNQLEQQVNQDSTQIQSYQRLLLELQRRGVISIQRDGRILIPAG